MIDDKKTLISGYIYMLEISRSEIFCNFIKPLDLILNNNEVNYEEKIRAIEELYQSAIKMENNLVEKFENKYKAYYTPSLSQ